MNKLSNDFEIAVRIYEYNRKGEYVWFNKLVDDLKGKMDKATVSKNLDRLFDWGFVEGGWEIIDERWTRTLKISEDMIPFIGSLYWNTE